MRVNTFGLSLKLLARDWRAGELTVLAVALLIAVSALTGVAFLTDRAAQAVELRAAESLAGDLRLASTRPLSDEFTQLAHTAGLETARITSMPRYSPWAPAAGIRLQAANPVTSHRATSRSSREARSP